MVALVLSVVCVLAGLGIKEIDIKIAPGVKKPVAEDEEDA
jgi:hypothetical protein